MKKIIFTLVVIVFAISACKEINKEKVSKEVDIHNSKNVIDWEGTYEGTLPCVNCKGIKTTITLKTDETFTKKEEFLEKNSTITEEQGTVHWEKEGNIISLCPNTKDPENYFIVGENQLIMLDSNKKKIKGKLADYYILNKK